ncbi:MAG: RsmE family RNA methyltransferase [Acidobacteria bacterium]|nr:RsmE family RNA methyltransferase [Acidobacteriota bacterium]
MTGPARHVPRVWVPAGAPGGEVSLRPEDAAHLSRTLRLAPGAAVEGFDGEGRLYRGVLASLSPAGGRLRVTAVAGAPPPAGPRVSAGLAVVRLELMDLAVRMAVELGCERFVPLLAGRTSLREAEAQARRRLERWERIALESLKQCRRLHRMTLAPPLPARAWFAASTADLRWFFHPGDPVPGGEPRPGRPPATGGTVRTLDLAVGPEGGWTEAEAAEARAAGFAALHPWPHVLRAETALVAALSLALARPPEGGGDPA